MTDYEVVCTADDPAWLEHRKRFVTGSEMSVLLGEAPSWFKDTYDDLVARKRTRSDDSFEPTRRMLWGSIAEEGNMRAFSKMTGLRTKGANVLFASTKYPGVASTIDGFVKAKGAVKDWSPYSTSGGNVLHFNADISRLAPRMGLLEMKQSDGWKKQVENWTEGVPRYYEIQLQTQLMVTGLTWGAIVCRLGVADIRAHIVHADEFLHEAMASRVEAFWKEVNGG